MNSGDYIQVDHYIAKGDGERFTDDELYQFIDMFIDFVEEQSCVTFGTMTLVDEEDAN